MDSYAFALAESRIHQLEVELRQLRDDLERRENEARRRRESNEITLWLAVACVSIWVMALLV